VIVGLALLFPLARLLASTDAEALGRVVTTAAHRHALLRSILLSVVVSLVSVGVCLPAAWALARGHVPGRRVVRAALAAPLSLSGIVVGFLGILVLGRVGLVPRLLAALTGEPSSFEGFAYSLGGLALAYLYFEIPRATLTLEPSLAALDGRLLEAARALGASRAFLARRVLWPLVRPAVLSTLAVTFAASMGSYGVALLLAGKEAPLTIPLYRYETGTVDDALAAAMALALAATTLAGTFSLNLLAARRSHA
jgi:putative spermidine/putrescine transport system permease protein